MLNPQRLLGGAVALLGLALLITGGWFASHVGSDGAATFRATPSGNAPLVLEPTLLNRSDRTLSVTITPAQGDTVWSALGGPSDADAAIAKAPVQRFTGVTLSGWAITHTTSGTGTPAALAAADIWREQTRTPGPVTYTIDQAQAPEVLVATGTKSPLASVEVTFTHRTWFYQALLTAIVGLVFLGIGGFTIWNALKAAPAGNAGADTPEPSDPNEPIDAADQAPEDGEVVAADVDQAHPTSKEGDQ